MNKLKIAVIGQSGQLAFELNRVASPHEIFCLGRNDINLFDFDDLCDVLDRIQPDAIINASAYTAVDKAELDQQNAFKLNAEAVELLGRYVKQHNIHLVHISTDYVFEGNKGKPYMPEDPIKPQGVYGLSKAEGEKRLTEVAGSQSCIIRTSWVYSSHGNNFVKTMIRLMNEKDELGVIDDQIGSPTWAHDLARACIASAEKKLTGTHHWTDEGVCSWYDFAMAIQQLGLEKGLIKKTIPVNPIPSEAYPTPAKRPHYSVMNKSSIKESLKPLKPEYWRVSLARMLDELSLL